MKPARKIPWDSAFWMERTREDWKPAPRVESEPLKIRSKRFNFEGCRKAWAAIGVIANEEWIRSHMARLKEWEGG